MKNKKKNKKPISNLLAQALVDFAIGLTLLLISKWIE